VSYRSPLLNVIGILGDTLVIYVINKKVQTVTNMYIVNLAIADECFLIGIPFLVTTINLHSRIFDNIICKIYMITTSIKGEHHCDGRKKRLFSWIFFV